jgi:hypothetical protein
MNATLAFPVKTAAAFPLIALLAASACPLRANIAGIFTFEDGVFTAIPFPVLPGRSSGTIFGIGINNLGQIAGTAFGEGGFLYGNGSFTPINSPGSTFSDVTDVNNLGQVVGFAIMPTGPLVEFVYSEGTYTALPPNPAPDFLHVTGINDSGEIVGSAFNGVNVHYSGFLFSNGMWSSLPIAAQSINNLGDIAADDNIQASVLSHTGTLSFLPNPPSCSDPQQPYINDSGTVVAFAICGIVEWKNGSASILDIPAPPGDFVLPESLAINDSGEIAGYFLGPVPEPSFLLPFAVLTAIATYRIMARRRKLNTRSGDFL